MKKDFRSINWEKSIPVPVLDEFPKYNELYEKAWKLAHDHVKEIKGLPQTPYMDEAFCETEVWIWDTCFMSLFCKFASDVFPGVETLNNFYEGLFSGKLFPIVTPSENEPKFLREKYEEPCRLQIHIADNPPLFSYAEYENALYSGDLQHIKTLLYETKYLQKHYEFLENLKEPILLPNVTTYTMFISEKEGYRWSGGKSGMDNTPRGRTSVPSKERPDNPDLLWVDAICQQALSAKMIAKLYKIVGDSENEKLWQKKYNEKKEIVNDLYWDNQDKFYYDIFIGDHKFCKVKTIGSYWTMTSGIATKERADEMVKKLFDDREFGGEVPLVSLSRSDAEFFNEGKYWRGSLWLPTAYATLRGLTNYGYHKEAHELGCKILKHMSETFYNFEPHTVWECYSPTECKPATCTDNKTLVRKDFCGWSALGPISIYIEYVLGFHTVNAFEKVIEWAKPSEISGKIGIKNFRFGDIVTDIIAEGNTCTVTSSGEYVLKINGNSYSIRSGENVFTL